MPTWSSRSNQPTKWNTCVVERSGLCCVSNLMLLYSHLPFRVHQYGNMQCIISTKSSVWFNGHRCISMMHETEHTQQIFVFKSSEQNIQRTLLKFLHYTSEYTVYIVYTVYCLSIYYLKNPLLSHSTGEARSQLFLYVQSVQCEPLRAGTSQFSRWHPPSPNRRFTAEPSSLHFLIIDLTGLQGIFSDLEMFLYPSPDLCSSITFCLECSFVFILEVLPQYRLTRNRTF